MNTGAFKKSILYRIRVWIGYKNKIVSGGNRTSEDLTRPLSMPPPD
jgi:hypothetical protein